MPGPITISRVESRKLVESFVELAEAATPNQLFSITVETIIGGLRISRNDVNAPSMKADEEFVKLLTILHQNPEIGIESVELRHTRGNGRNYHVRYTSEVGGGQIAILATDSSNVAITLITAIRPLFPIVNRDDRIANLLQTEVKAAIDYREASVSRLEAQVTKLAGASADVVRKNSEEITRVTAQLESQYQEKKANAEAEVARERAKLEKDRGDLDAERKQFEDKASKFARRDMQKKIDDVTKKLSSGLSPVTMQNAAFVHAVSVVVMGTIGWQIVSWGGKIFDAAKASSGTSSEPHWQMFGPLAALTAIFAGTLIFYLRWLARQADQSTHFDRARQKFLLDFHRATWIAELIFEYKEAKDKDLPEKIVGSFTEGLFKNETPADGKYHPVDDVTSVMKKVESIEFGSGKLVVRK